MRKYFALGCIAAAMLFATLLVAQDMPKASPPENEHAWLMQLVGEWESESEMLTAPGQPPMKSRGTESTRAIGDLWIVSEFKGEMPTGGSMTALLTLGFDPKKKKFVGTWVDSVMNHLWVYEGTLDATGKVLTLETEGPNMLDPGKTARYRDVIEIKSKDLRTLTSSARGDDGAWTTFVTAQVRRKK